MIAVLGGAYADGRTIKAGDFASCRAGRHHGLRVSTDGPCACLIAVQGKVHWRGWARLITPVAWHLDASD